MNSIRFLFYNTCRQKEQGLPREIDHRLPHLLHILCRFDETIDANRIPFLFGEGCLLKIQKAGHMSVLPGRMHAILSWGIGRFHKSLFEILAGLLGSMPIADFASTAFHSRHNAGITCQRLRPRKSSSRPISVSMTIARMSPIIPQASCPRYTCY